MHATSLATWVDASSSRNLSRWLLVAGAVGAIGVSIDLVSGPPANALPAPAAQDATRTALVIDDSVAMRLIDDGALEPGASVAAYTTSADDLEASAPAATVTSGVDDDALDPGASIGAYGS